MTRYAVGDIQGCLKPLQYLLDEVEFNPRTDQLWLVGDLINRGPQSLATLRFIHALGDCTRIVLGNHDLHFLAISSGAKTPGRSDTLDEILQAPDREELTAWLLQQHLMYSDPSGDFHMTHAGIPPIWDIETARQRAREVEAKLRSGTAEEFFHHMYGNQPAVWSDDLQGLDRLRVITNYFTRMRFCSISGELDLDNKLTSTDRPDFAPWFSFANRKTVNDKILFGHWAALKGKTDNDHAIGLDTGCVWGRSLTLMNLDTKMFHRCDCQDQ